MTLLHSTRIYTTSLRWGAALLTVTALAACTSSVRAPVESRSLGGAPTARYIDPATLLGLNLLANLVTTPCIKATPYAAFRVPTTLTGAIWCSGTILGCPTPT